MNSHPLHGKGKSQPWAHQWSPISNTFFTITNAHLPLVLLLLFLTLCFLIGLSHLLCVCVCVCVCEVTSVMSDSATLWTVARQACPSMGFSRQEPWSGLPCPPPGDLPDPGIEPESLISPALAGGFFTISATWEAYSHPDIHAIYLFSPILWDVSFMEVGVPVCLSNARYIRGAQHTLIE